MALTFSQTFIEKCRRPFLSLSVLRLLESEKVSKSTSDVLFEDLDREESICVLGDENVGVAAGLAVPSKEMDLLGVTAAENCVL